MRFNKQQTTLPIRNLDDILSSSQKAKPYRHGKLLPNTIRALIVGPSNCGKTNVMISLIEDPNGLKFENIYVYSKSLYQPKYEYLKLLIQPIKGMEIHTYSDNADILSLDEVKPNSIFIFDDVICEKQDKIRTYFCMGRHKNIDMFYLCQTYTKVPKHLIRDNANFIIMFKQDELNIKHVYNDHVGTDMSFDQFRQMCGECWKNEYGFLVISKDDLIKSGRYRKGFDTFIEV